MNRALLIVYFLMTTTSYGQKFSLSKEINSIFSAETLSYYTNDTTYQVSSYDRTGGNDDGFTGKYSFIAIEKGRKVIADIKGEGVLTRIWTPTPNTNSLYFYFDGKLEADLVIPFIDLFSGNRFPFIAPYCGNEIGGYYCYMPIPFKGGCKIVSDGDDMQFYQIQYKTLPSGSINNSFVLSDYTAIKDEILKGDHQPPNNDQTILSNIVIGQGEEIEIFRKEDGGTITELTFDGGDFLVNSTNEYFLTVSYDGQEAINVPLELFFGYSFGKPSMESAFIGSKKTANYCKLPMPFDKNIVICLVRERRNKTGQPRPIEVAVKYNNTKRAPMQGLLHTSWRSERPEKGSHYTFADIKGRGHYVGTVLQVQGLEEGMTGFFEGDDSTAVDGLPVIHGTGSEDYFNGGWYALYDRWDRAVSLPLHGCLEYNLPMARTGGYRFHTTDKISFSNKLYMGIEHGPVNETDAAYTSIAFYYGDIGIKDTNRKADTTIYSAPKVYTFFPELMDFTLGAGASIRREGLLKATGSIRVSLEGVPEGKYRLMMSYSKKQKKGGNFTIWQRQKPLTEGSISASGEDKFIEREYISDIDITNKTNSITINITGNLEFGQIFLEPIN